MNAISIRGPIVTSSDKSVYDYFGMECAAPVDIAAGLNAAGGGDVVLEINSKGGDVQAGVEMYALLMDYPGPVHIKIMSWCCSAATFPACAGTSEITPGGVYLVHNTRASTHGDHQDMDECKTMLQTADSSIAEIYKARTGKTLEEIHALMDADKIMSAQEAVEAGFVDKLMFQSGEPPQVQLVAGMDAGLLPRNVIDHTKKLLGDGKTAALLKAEIEILEMEAF